MMTATCFSWRWSWVVFVLLLGLGGAGCSKKPEVTWNERIGRATFDDAVLEMGPPDKSSELSDGSRVAEWLVGTSPSIGFGLGMGSYGSRGGVGVGQGVTSGGSGRYLRLTFGADGVLSGVGKVER